MVIKKKWTEQIQTVSLNSLIDTGIMTQGQALDSAMNTKFEIVTNVSGLLSYIKDYYLVNSDACVWKDMPIYMSSFKEKDGRIVYTLKDRLLKYLRFFTKMITDEGLARQMSIDRGFDNSGSASESRKNYYSETPQEELDNFETAIVKYASNLSKDAVTSSNSQGGTSYERAKTTSWDEGMKNLRLVFYNDLVDFISSIPNIIYNYYCLDSRPAPALVKGYIENIINAFKIEA